MHRRLRLWIALVAAALLAAGAAALHAMPELQAELLLEVVAEIVPRRRVPRVSPTGLAMRSTSWGPSMATT